MCPNKAFKAKQKYDTDIFVRYGFNICTGQLWSSNGDLVSYRGALLVETLRIDKHISYLTIQITFIG